MQWRFADVATFRDRDVHVANTASCVVARRIAVDGILRDRGPGHAYPAMPALARWRFGVDVAFCNCGRAGSRAIVLAPVAPSPQRDRHQLRLTGAP